MQGMNLDFGSSGSYRISIVSEILPIHNMSYVQSTQPEWQRASFKAYKSRKLMFQASFWTSMGRVKLKGSRCFSYEIRALIWKERQKDPVSWRQLVEKYPSGCWNLRKNGTWRYCPCYRPAEMSRKAKLLAPTRKIKKQQTNQKQGKRKVESRVGDGKKKKKMQGKSQENLTTHCLTRRVHLCRTCSGMQPVLQ